MTTPRRLRAPSARTGRASSSSEGAGVLVLAADEAVSAYGLGRKAEVLGVGWNSDALHFTRPNMETIILSIRMAIEDAGLAPGDVQIVNAHGTSTPKGDYTEIECLKAVFGPLMENIPVPRRRHRLEARPVVRLYLGAALHGLHLADREGQHPALRRAAERARHVDHQRAGLTAVVDVELRDLALLVRPRGRLGREKTLSRRMNGMAC